MRQQFGRPKRRVRLMYCAIDYSHAHQATELELALNKRLQHLSGTGSSDDLLASNGATSPPPGKINHGENVLCL